MWAVAKVRQSAKSAKEMQNGCNRIHTLIYNRTMTIAWDTGVYCSVCHLGLYSSGFVGCIRYGLVNGLRKTVFRYNYSELAGVFIPGGNSI